MRESGHRDSEKEDTIAKWGLNHHLIAESFFKHTIFTLEMNHEVLFYFTSVMTQARCADKRTRTQLYFKRHLKVFKKKTLVRVQQVKSLTFFKCHLVIPLAYMHRFQYTQLIISVSHYIFEQLHLEQCHSQSR